ncbi:MAG TPA: DUF4365 domain-containing protein [Allosphingosinicella sp.]|nr:DUF4365 domain-containing protein [Allosphingosinicella sp.]
MPHRPTSHQLEDASRRAFEALLPPAWVSRSKSHDYGTDLEVEIFDDQGSATGIIFLVQLKATDAAERATRLPIDIEHLDYFDSLDLPTLIVRYCRPDGSVHVRWNFNVERPLEEGPRPRRQMTLNYGADDRWTPETPARIFRTLSVLRRIKTLSPSQAVALVAGDDKLPPELRFHLDEAIHEAAERVPVLHPVQLDPGQLAIQLRATAGKLRVRIEGVTEFSFELRTSDVEELLGNILYGSAALLGKHRLHQHAARVAEAILQLERPCADKEIAFAACRALAATPKASVALAILNGLHHGDNVFGLLLFGDLRLGATHAEERYQALLEFMEASRAHAAEQGDEAAAATAHYSIANIHRSSGQLVRAVHHYNRSRRLRPEYLSTDYFLFETGSCLFLTGHYREAARWYLAAHAAGQPRISFVLGDALLFAGRVAEAVPHLRDAVEAGSEDGGDEAAVKLRMCTHLIARYGPNLPRAGSKARALALEIEAGRSSAGWEGVIAIDALNALGNFNAGIAASRQGRFADAWTHFLIAAFRLPTDVEAWANSLLCAANDRTKDVFVPTLSCALRLGGRDSYRRFRREIAQQGVAGEALGRLDELARGLLEEIEARRERGFTVRLLGDEGPEILHAKAVP